MLTTRSVLRASTLPHRLVLRGLATAAEVERGQISRTVLRTRYAEKVDAGGPTVHAALRPKDNQSPFIL